MKSLQEEFVEGRGAPVDRDGQTVIQMDRIPIRRGVVRLRFLAGTSSLVCGVALKAPGGGVELSDGRSVPLVHVWNEKELPTEVTHAVECPKGELRVWNLYRLLHSDGRMTEDAWTNNAGMVVDEENASCRRYRCSDGLGEFDPEDFTFQIEWEESGG